MTEKSHNITVRQANNQFTLGNPIQQGFSQACVLQVWQLSTIELHGPGSDVLNNTRNMSIPSLWWKTHWIQTQPWSFVPPWAYWVKKNCRLPGA